VEEGALDRLAITWNYRVLEFNISLLEMFFYQCCICLDALYAESGDILVQVAKNRLTVGPRGIPIWKEAVRVRQLPLDFGVLFIFEK
jgi:hypothetical protein